MSHQVKVSTHFGIQSFSNILRRSPLKTHLLKSRPVNLKIRLTAKDNNRLSDSNTTATKNSGESVAERNCGVRRAAQLDVRAAERKLRRQSFFEHVCGEKTERYSDEDASFSTGLKEGHIKVNKNYLNKSIIMNQPRARSFESNKKKFATCETLPATNEVSPLSSTSSKNKQFFRSKTGILNFPIKKSCLSKRGPYKFEFVPLTTTSVSEIGECSELSLESSFHGSGISSEIIELMDDLSRNSEGWVDLDDSFFKRGARDEC